MNALTIADEHEAEVRDLYTLALAKLAARNGTTLAEEVAKDAKEWHLAHARDHGELS